MRPYIVLVAHYGILIALLLVAQRVALGVPLHEILNNPWLLVMNASDVRLLISP